MNTLQIRAPWKMMLRVIALAGVAAMTMFPTASRAADCGADAGPGVDWTECVKKVLILSGSDFNGAILTGTDFTSTDLRDSNLLAANMEKATLVRASLAGSHAKGTNFSRIEAYRTDFGKMDAQGAIFNSAEVQRSSFAGSNLTNVDFTKAEMGRAQFGDADISGSKFALSNLARADFRKAKFTGPLDFAGAFFFLTRIDGLDLSQATGLAQWQIDMACGDANTKLPAGLNPAANWPCKHDST